jgi:hypothetical protein
VNHATYLKRCITVYNAISGIFAIKQYDQKMKTKIITYSITALISMAGISARVQNKKVLALEMKNNTLENQIIIL